MPIDRAATLRNAEKLLRQGKLEPAIAEYARLVEEQPRDWNTTNVLGDLYVRAGQIHRAVEQFLRIADTFYDDGFLPKAGALYKKILKLAPEDEHALLRSGEIAAAQGLLADARAHYGSVEAKRLAANDVRGAAEMRVRIGTLDPGDVPARRSAAAARLEMGDAAGAARDLQGIAADLAGAAREAEATALLQEAAKLAPEDEAIARQLFDLHVRAEDFVSARGCARTAEQFKGLGALLDARGRHAEAIEALCDAAHVNPDDLPLRVSLAREFLAHGNVADAGRYLTVEAAGSDVELLITAAEIELRRGNIAPGIAVADRLLGGDTALRDRLATLACAIGETDAGAGFALLGAIIRIPVAQSDWAGAAGLLQSFVAHAPGHIGALQQLVEICVDGELDAVRSAQAQLADAYLGAGLASEARFIAEDLIDREPDERKHIERLRRALELLGEPDPDAIIVERLNRQSPFVDVLLDEDVTGGPAVARAPASSHAIDIERLLNELDPPTATPARARAENVEIDLSFAAPDLESVFEQFRGEAARRAAIDTAEKDFQRALELQAAGDVDGCIDALQAASRAPTLRFATASRLGRIYRDRNMLAQSVEWMERAAQAPPPSPDEYHTLLFDLAQGLEAAGEVTRALAVCLELRADAGSYRDVDARVDRLTKVQARG